MEKQALLKLVEQFNDKDAIGMILSNYVDYVGEKGGMISVKRFDEVSECVIEWADKKNQLKTVQND